MAINMRVGGQQYKKVIPNIVAGAKWVNDDVNQSLKDFPQPLKAATYPGAVAGTVIGKGLRMGVDAANSGISNGISSLLKRKKR